MLKGIIFDIQRFSIHDGPGIRTTVFLKGCPLRCLWCHNPESQEPSFQVWKKDTGFGIREEIVGREVTVDEVIDEVIKDKKYYERSGGGLTLSGGEPLLQGEFSLQLLKAAKMNGIHTAIETCGYTSSAIFREVLPYTDLFLFDYKVTDPKKHRQLTGKSNEKILENLKYLHKLGARITLRCPLIPTINDDPGHLRGIAKLSKSLSSLEGVEIMAYHNLGVSKERYLGREPAFPDLKNANDLKRQEWIKALTELGCENVQIG